MPLCYIGRMSLNDQSIDIVLDLQGLMCPMPLLKAKKALKISKVIQGDANLIEDSVLYEGQNPNDLLRSNSERMDRPI